MSAFSWKSSDCRIANGTESEKANTTCVSFPKCKQFFIGLVQSNPSHALQASFVAALLLELAKQVKECRDKPKYDMAAFVMLARYHQRCAGIESCICPEMFINLGGKINMHSTNGFQNRIEGKTFDLYVEC